GARGDKKGEVKKVADSRSRNLTQAVPGLIGEVKSSRGSVSATFRLYHNINVVYEYLNSLTDAAASLGRKEEFDPLNRDASAVNRLARTFPATLSRRPQPWRPSSALLPPRLRRHRPTSPPR